MNGTKSVEIYYNIVPRLVPSQGFCKLVLYSFEKGIKLGIFTSYFIV